MALGDDTKSHPLRVRELKQKQAVSKMRKEMSHPLRVRELKRDNGTAETAVKWSHPLRVRELKLYST